MVSNDAIPYAFKFAKNFFQNNIYKNFIFINIVVSLICQ